MQARQLLVGHVADQFEQFRILAEEFFPQVCTTLGLKCLVLAVDALFHALEQQAFVVALEEGVPVGAPDDLDDIPAGAAEDAFEFVDDALVAAHRAVEALQVAVDDEDEVVELFARGDGDGAEGIDFVRFAIADKGPDLARGFLDQAAVLEIAHEARLIDRVQRADAHRNCGEAPEIRHQPWVRIGRKAGLVAQFVAEVLEVVVGEAAFKIRACVDAG